MKIVKLSSKHQIVIPKEIRKRLSLEAGGELAVEVEEEKVVLRPRPKNYTDHMLGLGRKVWQGVEATEYVRKERESWEK